MGQVRVADYVARAERYAKDVVAGKVPACQYVRQACRRQIADRKRWAKTGPYVFDRQAANAVCEFLEQLPHVKGRWAAQREKLTLTPWMCFVWTTAFGWLRRSDGKRRFRVVYVEVPRKNAKSTQSAGVGLYCFTDKTEFGAEVYSGATTEKQAWEVFRPAKQMCEREPQLCATLGVVVNAKNLNIPSRGGRFEPVIGKPGDGASPSCAIIDEFHEHQTDDQYDTMKTGMGAREQPLMLVITTAGSDTAGPCYALRSQVDLMLMGTVPDEELFGIIYTIDEQDDWTTEEALIKANPNAGVSVSLDYLKSQQREAIQHARHQSTFKTKHLNVWVTARSPYFNVERWTKLGDPGLSLETLEGLRCFAALDIAEKMDINASLRVFVSEDAEPHYYMLGRFYLPEKRIEDTDKKHYWGWYVSGHLIGTPGDYIDFHRIRDDLLEDHEAHGITQLGYDPHNAAQLAQECYEAGIEIVEIPQNTSQFSEPMKWVEALITAGRLHHDGNPVMTWMMGNVVAKEDAKGNVYPRKESREKKIDGPVALIMATKLAQLAPATDDLGISFA